MGKPEEMTKEAFAQLKEDIEDLMDELERLQKIYRGQTGVSFMPPLRLGPRK